MTAEKVPNLRFPEFRFRRGWPYTILGAVLEEHGRNSDGASEVHSVSLTKGIIPQVEHLGRSFAASDTAHYSLVRPFDVVYTRSPLSNFPLGIVKQHKAYKNAIVSPLYGVFGPRNKYLGRIIEAYFDSPSRSIRFLDPLAQKGAKNTIQLSNGRFLSGALYLPADVDEQQKIADCLGSLDDLIAAEWRKVQALRQHKQGLMQRIFPQPGETVPRLRFREFHGAGEWKPHKFGDFVVRSFYGTSASTSETGQYPVLRMGNMSDGGLDFSNLAYIDLDREEFEHFRLQKGDILLNRTNSRDLVGKVSIFDRDSECITASYIVSFRLDKKRIDPLFCNLMLNTQMLQSRIKLLATPSISQANINPATFRTGLDVVIPKLAEQQRIASCLSSLDDVLAAQSRKVEGLKAHKQGLLQQLFPRSEEESR
jgi:type I restriction enzyme S subunit